MTTDRVQTIADIARLAGVSKSTVSRALSDSPRIGSETKERIRAIVREHRFQLNDSARRLSRKQSETVGLVTYPGPATLDPFLLELMTSLLSGLREHGYDLLVLQANPRDTEWVGRYLESGRVDGFVVLGGTCTQHEIDALNALDAPFIVWGTPVSVRGRYSSVSGDNALGGRLATEHLLASGRTRIGFLGGPAEDPQVQARYEGYEAALESAGIEVDPRLVTYGSWMASDRMRSSLERAPDLDGVFANSDVLAIAAMQELQARRRAVPDDVAVVGYDDVAVAALADPPLTTVRQNLPLAGKLLAENLLAHLHDHATTHVSIPPELVVRASA